MGSFIFAAGIALIGLAVMTVIGIRNRIGLKEPRFEGTWQSDAEATIEEWRKVKPLGGGQEKLLRKTFGRARVTFKKNGYKRDLDGEIISGTFRVLRREKEVVVIKGTSGFKSETYKIRFTDDDTHWIYLDQTGTWECFRRIK